MKQFAPTLTTDKQLNQTNQATNESFRSLQNMPHNNGILIENISLTSGQDNVIQHKLGRNLVGAQVYLNDTSSKVWFDQSNNIAKNTFIYVQCEADCIVNLWVF